MIPGLFPTGVNGPCSHVDSSRPVTSVFNSSLATPHIESPRRAGFAMVVAHAATLSVLEGGMLIRHNSVRSKGSSAVELAIVAPLIVAFIMGQIEASRLG